MMSSSRVRDVTLAALDDAKAEDVRVMDVADRTDVVDYMVIASATSKRHASSIADRLRRALKGSGIRGARFAGESSGEWIVADCGDVAVHIFQPSVREYYRLESLWSGPWAEDVGSSDGVV